ncbi:hypothetical protein DOTSEDRAFT_129838 [Dothistroma septosporum NZE10]|uniref:L-gulonate 3-dehydrogenase n=1 Tax=Dothistroma septosporum (strain NZE10 / CBS 128990) TaxID=675120 RepID=N1PK63_DOTSN|nr:hypothetical protein DOTSEDRAFT_129838 [Dothistroma septosporum NZE10]
MAGVIRTVGVVGTGVIGASWTGLFLARGLRVIVSDPSPGAKEELEKNVKSLWPRLEKLGLSRDASLKNYEFVGGSMQKDHYRELDFVQENTPEEQSLKEKIVGEIDANTKESAIIASSSSGIPSSQFIGKCEKRPERVLIAHPFAPPHLMPLVEVVPHPQTDDEVIKRAMDFFKSLGKHPMHIKHEIPGFIANRLQAAVSAEAYSLVHRGILSAEDLDAAVTTSIGPRYALTGPFMSNVIGGGSHRDGFKDFATKLGPAVQDWLKDMREHAFESNEENIIKLNESVHKQLDKQPPGETEAERDEVLIELQDAKKTKKYLV